MRSGAHRPFRVLRGAVWRSVRKRGQPRRSRSSIPGIEREGRAMSQIASEPSRSDGFVGGGNA
ncbi:MAG: hypothetical protein D6725_16875 [Planctomycetota bacterium]|nr:MAG: hypothetical protein D6725_16875 [Planctomycetota bacterium]